MFHRYVVFRWGNSYQFLCHSKWMIRLLTRKTKMCIHVQQVYKICQHLNLKMLFPNLCSFSDFRMNMDGVWWCNMDSDNKSTTEHKYVFCYIFIFYISFIMGFGQWLYFNKDQALHLSWFLFFWSHVCKTCCINLLCNTRNENSVTCGFLYVIT